MKKDEVKIGGLYVAKVSDKLTTVRIDGTNSRGGWNATNTATGKHIRIKSAQRLRGPAKAGKKAKVTKVPEAAKAAVVNDAKATEAAQAAEAKHGKFDERTGHAPRSELTRDEAAKLEKVRAKKKAKSNGEAKPKRVSALAAAAQVLQAEGKPMRAKDLIEVMAERGLWSSPNGRTPEATLYAAMTREISKAVETGKVSRFRKVERGQFEYNVVAAKGK